MPAGSVTVRLNLNSAGYSASLSQAQAQMQAFGRTVKGTGHAGASDIQAISGALRVVEGNMTNNIRAAERFLATIPAIGKAAQAIFPIIGGIAFLGVFKEIIESAIKAQHELQQIRNVANEAFAGLTESSQKNADSLRVTNDKLEEQIAILQHKPVNNLALALDEARLRADDLASSLNKDYEGFKKIVEDTQKGVLSTLFNKSVDGQLASGLEDRLANIRTLARQQRDDLKKGDKAGADDSGNKLRAAQDEALAYADAQAALRKSIVNKGTPREASYESVYGKRPQDFDAINAAKDVVSTQKDQAAEEARNIAAEALAKKLEGVNKANEAMKQAQARMLRNDELAEREQNAFNKMTVNEEILFWSDLLSDFRKGSEAYIAVQDKIYAEIAKRPDITAVNKKNQATAAKFTVEGSDILNAGAADFQRIVAEQMDRSAEATKRYYEEVAKGTEIQRKASAEVAEASIAMDVARGRISGLQAAQTLSAIHANDHAAALRLVNEALAEQIRLINSQPNDKATAEDKANQVRNAQQSAANQTQQLNGAYQTTQTSDSNKISDSTISGAVRTSLDQMVTSFTDMADNLKALFPRLVDGLNDDLVKAITGHGSKADFGRTLTQAGQGALKIGLQGLEGGVLKAAGLGRADGSRTNPWYVIAVAGQGASPSISTTSPNVSATVGGLASLIPGGSFIQPFITAAAGFLPHFASGGDIMGPSIVGEKGPELFTPNTSGRITPNSALGSMGGMHLHVDARGSNDPEAINAAVRRAAPHIAAAAVQATHKMDQRHPRAK